MSDHGESLFGRYRDEVRSQLSLRDLVEQCSPKHLRATGRNSLICCSPLREDRHPSFSVFENGGGEYMAYDHATKESFDLYAFVERREGLDFVGAVKWCGDRVGLTWDDYKRQHGGEGGGRPPKPEGFTQEEWDRAIEKTYALDERQFVGNVQQAMVQLCHAWHIQSPKLVRYVEERWGISEATQHHFMLGYVPPGFAQLLDDWHQMGEFPYSRKQLVKTGWFLARPRIPMDPDPPLRCLFDGRLLYPYMFRGNCRYAAARLLYEGGIEQAYFDANPWEEAKFKKALVGGRSHPDVSQYVQNDLLYNADNANRSRTGFSRIVIVEGPSDCMAMVEAGYDCVAPVTTSIRNEDVAMLLEAVSKYKEVILATDTDVKPDGRRPGLEGALRMAPDLLKADKRVRMLVFPLPKGETKVDPASWALTWKKSGKEDDPFAELMAGAQSVAGALVGFLDPGIGASELPSSLDQIVRFAREAKASKAEIEEIARLVKERLRGNFSKSAIKQAMGEADERLDAEAKAEAAKLAVEDSKALNIEGRVTEHGGFDQPGKTRCYQGYAKDGTPLTVSTFILQPSRIIIAQNGDRQIEVSVHNETDTTLLERWTIPKHAWVSRKDFISSFPHERMQFTGSDHNVQAIYQIVSERAARLAVPVVCGESIVGLHRTAGGLRLILPNETWSVDGVMENPDIVYATEVGSVSFCGMLKVDGQQQPAEVDGLVTRIMTLLFELNDHVKLTTLSAWLVGCYFLPEIREMNGGKASILDVFGTPQSAKTTTLHQVLNKTLQPFGPTFEPSTPAETKFATIRHLSWSNTFVAAFDEFRTNEAGHDFIRLLRTGYSGGQESRGFRDQSVKGYSLSGAVVVSGEMRADVDAAMSDRLVIVGFDKSTIEKRDVSGIVDELVNKTEERWRVATDILQWRMRVDLPSIRKWWAESKEHAGESLARMKLKVSPRTRDLCSEIAFRLRTWNQWLDHRAERPLAVPRPGLDAVLRLILEGATGVVIPDGGGNIVTVSAKSLVVHALEEITPYAVSQQFQERKCYRLAIRNGRKMLVLHPGSLAIALAKESKTRGRQDPTNGEAALKRAAKEEYEKEGDMGWLVDPSFPYRMGSADDVGDENGKTARLRCWLIDIDKAHERVGVELDWPGTPATWGGDRKTNPTIHNSPLPPWKRLPPRGSGGGEGT
jgi:DNA primase